MKKILKVLHGITAATVVCTGFNIHASPSIADGPSTSGGGMAVVCRGQDQKITFAELLDLYEARNVYYFSLPAPSGSVERDFLWAANHTYTLQGQPGMMQTQAPHTAENLHNLFDVAKMTAPGEKLPLLGDQGRTPKLPNGCKLEQLAIFHDTNPNVMEIDSEIWNALDSLNRAALATHEEFYLDARGFYERTSESTREFVAHIYASSNVPAVMEGAPQNAKDCFSSDPRFDNMTSEGDSGWISPYSQRTTNFRFFPIMTPEGLGTRLQFSGIASRPTFTRTVLDLVGTTFATKESFDNENHLVMIATEPGKDIHVELPLRSTMLKQWTVEIFYKTGSPVRLVTKKDGVVQSDELLTICY